MSKTDKTAPWRVKVHYEPTYLVEVHDHRDHVCDLPPRPEVGKENVPGSFGWMGHRKETYCHWGYSMEYITSKWARCGCWMCSYPDTRRKNRRNGKKATRNWQDEY